MMRIAALSFALILCALLTALVSCGGQDGVSNLSSDASVEAVKASSTPATPGIAWPQAGNTVNDGSYQTIATYGTLTDITSMYLATGGDNLSQPVISDDYHVFLSSNDGILHGEDCYGVDPVWSYAPPNPKAASFAVTPAWHNPDGVMDNGDERVYHVYQNTYNNIYVCSVTTDGVFEWITPYSLGDILLRSSPRVTDDYVFIAEAQDVPKLATQNVLLHAIDRATGDVLHTYTITNRQSATSIALDSDDDLYLVAQSSVAETTVLFKFSYDPLLGFTLQDQTAGRSGNILLQDPYGYDTQQGPVVYEYDGNEYVAHSLADTSSGITGGVYAYDTDDLTTVAWDYLLGIGLPMFCSGLSVTETGFVFLWHRDTASFSWDQVSDEYEGVIVGLRGDTGALSFISRDFEGRVGSAVTVSSDLVVYAQARYQYVNKLYSFNFVNTPTIANELAGSGQAGNGSISLASYREGMPGLFFIESSSGQLNVLHEPIPFIPGTPWPQAGNTYKKCSMQPLSLPAVPSQATIDFTLTADTISQPVVSDDYHVYTSNNFGMVTGADCYGVDPSWYYTPINQKPSSFAVTPAWDDPDSDPNTDNSKIFNVYQDTSDNIWMNALNPDGSLAWTSSASLGNKLTRSAPTVYGDYIFIAEGVEDLVGGCTIYVSGIDKYTGTVIESAPFATGYDSASSIAIYDALACHLYFLVGNSTSYTSRLVRTGWSGGFTSLSNTPVLPGYLPLEDGFGYDSQHGPVIYTIGATDYVAFSLASDPVGGNTGGVYCYQTSNLGTPEWTYLPAVPSTFCSQLACCNGLLALYHRDIATIYNPLSDTYHGKITWLYGATGLIFGQSVTFNGRIGSVPTMNDIGVVYAQSRYQNNHSVLRFNPTNSPCIAEVLATQGVAGNGPVTLADYQEGVPGLFFIENSAGYINVLY